MKRLPGLAAQGVPLRARLRFRLADRILYGLGIAGFALTIGLAPPLAARAEETVSSDVELGADLFGWVERVIVLPTDLRLEAKLDTGADTSSLHAENIRRVRRGDKRYVRFELQDDETGEVISIARPLIRRTRIKRHSGEHQRRYVVAFDVCLGRHRLRDVEVSLIDRSVFQYPMLLGRSALEGRAVVDPSVTFTSEPACGSSTDEEAP